jgi:hypothetical protein
VLGNEPAEHVDRAGRRERDHDLDRATGVVLRLRQHGRVAAEQQARGHAKRSQ